MRAFWHNGAGLWSLYVRQASAIALGYDQAGKAVHSHAPNLERGGATLVPREAIKVAAPIVAGVSMYWEGNDGPWSSFVLQVGNRSQEVRVFPSTASSSTWVVYDNPGCNNVPIADCPSSRGKTFQPNNSATWTPNLQWSIYELGIEENLLGRKAYGEYGYDGIMLGYLDGGGPKVEKSVVTGIGDQYLTWLGALGLNPRPVNFTSMPGNPQTSFVQALMNQGDIPSLSWAYTAGAQYRLNSVFGSLVFGGYDESRFSKPPETNSTLNFPFYTDIERDLLVGISSITASNTTSSTLPATLLSEGIFALIDSTVPHLWLPEKVCKAFESAFGLTWDTATELYKLSTKQHETLVKLNPSVTIKLSPSLSSAADNNSVSITLPYSAFDLNVSWPYGNGDYKNESAYYFPLKRANETAQYTLGRAFLQEAYLIADYERQNFSVWPCKWDDKTTKESVVPISPINAPKNLASGRKKLSNGAIAGIALGGAATVIILTIALWLYIRHRSRKFKAAINLRSTETNTPSPHLSPYPDKTALQINELGGMPKHELHEHYRCEAEPGGKFEMDGEGLPHEADGQEKRGMYEMDAGGDGVGLADSHGELVRITVEPPTAISPGPGSAVPSLVSGETMERFGENILKSVESNTMGGSEIERNGAKVEEEPWVPDEKDGVRSFFGFLKAFRASGKT